MLSITPRIRRLIDMALDEDEVGFDVSSAAFFEEATDSARLVAKESLVVCGLPAARAVFERVDDTVAFDPRLDEGARAEPGELLATVEGNTLSLLGAERTALNFLQRMCGIATKTARYVGALGESSARIVDTRKTLPGYRELDKYAVRCGGGHNHRYNLSGGVMIKDNHIAAAGGIDRAVAAARDRAPHTVKIEVECDDLEQVRAAVDAGADIILLDNMTNDEMADAVDVIRDRGGSHVVIEASGNITLERLPELRDLGLDVISSGALTHSVEAADISMRMG